MCTYEMYKNRKWHILNLIPHCTIDNMSICYILQKALFKVQIKFESFSMRAINIFILLVIDKCMYHTT